MIQNYAHQKELMQARIDIKSCETMLGNIIDRGTSCSPFETQIIVAKAKEVFCIGEHSEDGKLQVGQMIWLAVSAKEPPGKPLKECQMKRVILTYFKPHDEEVYRSYGVEAKRKAQISRMTTEVMDQEAYLTQEDLSKILGHDVRTIRRDIRELKKEEIIVPTRGQQKDIGPGITHREKAVKLFLDGLEPLEIGRMIKHSLHSVERYVDTFCRVVFCQQQVHNTLQTALIVGISVSQVNVYLAIKAEYSQKKEYKARLEAIERRGTAYWETIDFKKNALLRGRRPK